MKNFKEFYFAKWRMSSLGKYGISPNWKQHMTKKNKQKKNLSYKQKYLTTRTKDIR
jgi:hypothetical protein